MLALRLAALWVPDWPVLAATHQQRLSEHLPVATANAREVTAVSAVARRRGVRRGMKVRTARAICPEVELITDDPVRDVRLFEQVALAVDQVAAGVEIIRPGLLVLPAFGAVRHVGGEEELAQSLVNSVAQHTGWESAVGIAEGLLGVVSAARRSHLVPPGETADFLYALPISELMTSGITSTGQSEITEFVDLLLRLGIRTLGQFGSLPIGDVTARFGQLGQWAHRLVTGRDTHVISVERPEDDITVNLVIDPPAQRVDQAAFAAKQAAGYLHSRLITGGLTCGRISILVRTTEEQILERTWRHEGGLGVEEITNRVRWQLEGWIDGRSGLTPTAAMEEIILTALDVHAAGVFQAHLWGRESQKDHKAHRTLTRVHHLLGTQGVYLPVIEGGRTPRHRVRLSAWGDENTSIRDPQQPWPGKIPAPEPTLVFSPPQEIIVTDNARGEISLSPRGELPREPHWLTPKTAGGVKRQFRKIVGWTGPWHVDERWWEGEAPRSHFQFVLEDQRAVLAVFSQNTWMIEACYD